MADFEQVIRGTTICWSVLTKFIILRAFGHISAKTKILPSILKNLKNYSNVQSYYQLRSDSPTRSKYLL